jgi:hypothetical protein
MRYWRTRWVLLGCVLTGGTALAWAVVFAVNLVLEWYSGAAAAAVGIILFALWFQHFTDELIYRFHCWERYRGDRQ